MQGMLLEKVLQMSLISSWCILVILVVRLFLIRCGREFAYCFWAVLFFNLCIPVSIPGAFSLIPRQVSEFTVIQEAQNGPHSEEEAGLPQQGEDLQTGKAGQTGQDLLSEQPSKESSAEVDALRQALVMGELIWIAGILGLLAYFVAGMIRLNARLSGAHRVSWDKKRRIAEIAGLPAPFVWGLFRPVIYLPAGLEQEEKRYILAHESCHRKRGDHIWKILMYFASVLHWFNPLVWLSYVLFCRDMEISCDEKVLAKGEKDIRGEYAASLLKYAAKQNGYRPVTLTFGEPSVRVRMKNVLKYKKKGILFTLLGIWCFGIIGAYLICRPAPAKPASWVEKPKTEDEPEISLDLAWEADAEPIPEAEKSLMPQGPLEVENNGGTIVRVGERLYYMGGTPICSDGSYLYVTGSEEEGEAIYRYELDGVSHTKLADGVLLGTGADGMLYSARRGEDGLLLEKIRTSDGQATGIPLGMPIQGQVNGFYGDEERLIFAAGYYEGSAGMLNGGFYSVNRDTGEWTSAHLTDSDRLWVVKDWIYYQKYEAQGDGASQLCRADWNLENEEQIGENLNFLAYDSKADTILASRDGAFVRLEPDGSREEILLPENPFGWEAEEGDRLIYSQVNVVNGRIYAQAQLYGYREGISIGWRDAPLEEQYFYMEPNGSGLELWSPDEI